MTEMFGEAWSPMSVPDLAPDDDDDDIEGYVKSMLSTTYDAVVLFTNNYAYG